MASTFTYGELHWSDITIIALYFSFVFGIGIWSSIRARGGGVSGYFLASRGMNWFLVGASLFGSNIGSEHFIGLAGTSAAVGIATAGFELNAMFIVVILGWVFLPVYIASGVFTMPEYLMKRFGGTRIRIYLSCLSLILSIFTKVAADLFAGSVFIKQALNWDLYAAIGLQLAIAGVITITGGLHAVMWVDTTQVILMVTGSMTLMILGFYRVGGWSEMERKYYLAVPQENYTIVGVPACASLPSEQAMHLFRDVSSTDLPWTGMVFGLVISSIWYWCTDQVIVQKALSSRNYSHAKLGCCFTGVLKYLPFWLMVFPGMIARVLFPNEVGCTNPDVCEKICYSRNGCTNIAYPLLVTRLLPAGVRGIMVAVMMSTITASLSSIFNSSSTIFTMDIWRTIRKKPSDLEVLIVGRLFVLVMVVVAVLWIPVIAAYPSSQLFNYVQSVTSYLAPPICATFILAITVPRVNEKGAFSGLIVGLIIGLTRFGMEVAYGAPACNEVDTRPAILTKVHYLNFGIFLFFVVLIVNLTVSYATKPIPKEKLERLTYWSRHKGSIRKTKRAHLTLPDSKEVEVELEDINNNLNEIAEATKTHQPPNSNEISTDKKWIDALYCICGVTKPSEQAGPVAEAGVEKHVNSIEENPTWRRYSNLAAILLLSAGVFTYTYWA